MIVGSIDGITSTTPDRIHNTGSSHGAPGVTATPTTDITIRLQANPGSAKETDSALDASGRRRIGGVPPGWYWLDGGFGWSMFLPSQGASKLMSGE
jgi:hypothetical protein